MTIQTKDQNSVINKNLFFNLAILTAAFMLLEISFFIQVNSAYLDDYATISHQIVLPYRAIPGFIFFFTAQLGIHLFYLLLVYFCIIYNKYMFHWDENLTTTLTIGLWITGLLAALSANAYYFPNSAYSDLLTFVIFNQTQAYVCMILFAGAFMLAMISASIGFLIWLTHHSFNYALFFLILFATSTWFYLSSHTRPAIEPRQFSKPNIFIIGVDSLRPDFLGYFGSDLATPFFDQFLNEATVFSEAITPLARTFPSWSSILTGEHPKESGIRTNLMDVSKVDLSHTMPVVFKQHGYKTIYATDEVRFSNIDQAFGFDTYITPPIGLNDFLLGTFNDFPFSNLIVNTRLGRWLFPNSFANRPVFATYQPGTFVDYAMEPLQRTQQQPIFMAVHFCLPHHPYLFADKPGRGKDPLARYQASIVRADEQVRQFMTALQNAHLLDHAIVVILSDHGEALELHGDRVTDADKFTGRQQPNQPVPKFFPPNFANESVNQSGGHGTDVLGLTQYHSVLAIKLFGMGSQHIGSVPGVTPLNQLKATLLSLAAITTQPDAQADIVREKRSTIPTQHVFLESDFSPPAVRSVYPQVHEAMMDGLQIFRIDPETCRLTVKEDMQNKIIRSKQYADIYDGWMLALYPQEQGSYTQVLVNLQTGMWTDNMQSNFALHSPSKQMLTQLKAFYGKDISS